RRNLERRVNRIAPLFADEFIRRELDARPAYFQGKTMNMPPKGGESC
ncbi:theronine dehydrogenase, partial [Salmonella enterica]|nr:theronine dehydrogenase [Salmonella enterica subsp. enterica serovar Minnesota]